jgi:thymidylate synthase
MNGLLYCSKEEQELIIKNRLEQQHEEYKYLHLLEKILNEGVESADRTNVGTKSLFGTNMRFSLRNSFPLFTTRKIFFRGAVEELLWMIRGKTDAKLLQEKNIHIWDGNTTSEFIAKRGLNYTEGQIGKLYGFQMRNWGGDWEKHLNGERTGIDQLKYVVDTLRKDKTSRRLIISYWNASSLDEGVLTPCHAFVQFRVNQNTNELDCMMTQRSCDFCCGVVLNVPFYSLLTLLISKIVNLKPGEFIWSGGDSHIYLNHISNANLQINRTPFPFPTIEIPDIKTIEDIENLKFEDFKLNNYLYHPQLKYEMAI